MKKTAALALTTAIVGATTMGVASVAEAHAATGAHVQLVSTSLGKVLANGRGFTLYMFTRDGRNHDSCAAVSGCLGVWPMLAAHGNTVAGTGVKHSLLGTTKLANGKRQVTYAGHPLYMYSGDFSPHSTAYVGARQFGGMWYALSAGGKSVK